MKFEIQIARKLRLNSTGRSTTATLNVAVAGIVLAVVIMIVSVAVVTGFKQTVISKIGQLDSHVKVHQQQYDEMGNLHNSIEFSEEIRRLTSVDDSKIQSVYLIGETPCVIKSEQNFSGLRFKGLPDDYDLHRISDQIKEGKADLTGNGILVSRTTADKLGIKTGDRITVYFMNPQAVKLRKCTVNGIFASDFEEYDKNVIIGNISIIQSVNRWNDRTGSYLEINCHDINDAPAVRDAIFNKIKAAAEAGATAGLSGYFQVSSIQDNNPAYFSWLDLLNMNIIVVLGLMAFVACFAIIACLIIVVLNRINTIGVLKALGATNRSIQLIFVYTTMRIIVRAMLIGNAVAFLFLFLQSRFHIVKLDASSYFMSYVPVEYSHWLIWLNAGIFVISLLSLIIPSFIVSSIQPTKTMKFE